MNSSRTLRLLKGAISSGCEINLSLSPLPRGGYIVNLTYDGHIQETARLGFQEALREAVTNWLKSKQHGRRGARRAKK